MKLFKLFVAPAILVLSACQPFEGHLMSSGEGPFTVPALSVMETTDQVTVTVTGDVVDFVDFYLDKELSPRKTATQAPFEFTMSFDGLTPGDYEIRVVTGVQVLGEVSTVTRHVPFTVKESMAIPPQAGCDQVGTNAFFGCYYIGSEFNELAFTKMDSSINFNFGQGSPDSRLPNDGFSMRWRGDFSFATSGTYEFSARVDDGIRVFVDGTIIIDEWRNQPATNFSKTLDLSAGVHRIEVEYYEAHSSAEVSLSWAAATEPEPMPQAPSAPRSLAANAQGQSQINLNWQAPSNAAQVSVQSYRIFRNGSMLTTVSGTQTSYSNTGLQAGTNYSYEVSAISTGGVESARSAAASATTSQPVTNTTLGARPVPRSRNPASTDTFVSPSGSGTSCTQSSPCALTQGLSRGTFVWMLNGTYNMGSTQVRIGDNKTLEALEPKKAIIDFKKESGRVTLGHRSTLRNVVVRNSGVDGGGIRIFGSYSLIEGVISEGHDSSGLGIHGNYNNLTDVRDSSGRVIASYNKIVDSIFRDNFDNCKKFNYSSDCSDSDADGISVSSGVGNEIIHCEAEFNADDGFDIWRSYRTSIVNSIANNNGKVRGQAGRGVGNGNGFKMGAGGGKGPEPNRHVIEGNWSYDNRSRNYTSNGGRGFERVENNFCGSDQRRCTNSDYTFY